MKSMAPFAVLRSTFRALLIVLLLLFATERPAMAYTDPGTGALIWQTLVAGGLGLWFYLRRYVSRFRKKKEESKD